MVHYDLDEPVHPTMRVLLLNVTHLMGWHKLSKPFESGGEALMSHFYWVRRKAREHAKKNQDNPHYVGVRVDKDLGEMQRRVEALAAALGREELPYPLPFAPAPPPPAAAPPPAPPAPDAIMPMSYLEPIDPSQPFDPSRPFDPSQYRMVSFPPPPSSTTHPHAPTTVVHHPQFFDPYQAQAYQPESFFQQPPQHPSLPPAAAPSSSLLPTFSLDLDAILADMDATHQDPHQDPPSTTTQAKAIKAETIPPTSSYGDMPDSLEHMFGSSPPVEEALMSIFGM